MSGRHVEIVPVAFPATDRCHVCLNSLCSTVNGATGVTTDRCWWWVRVSCLPGHPVSRVLVLRQCAAWVLVGSNRGVPHVRIVSHAITELHLLWWSFLCSARFFDRLNCIACDQPVCDRRGRAEAIRAALSEIGLSWKHVLKTGPEFMDMKPLLAFGSLPLLEIDGLYLVQSGSILRYLARAHRLCPDTAASMWRYCIPDSIVCTQ